jgi:hypothetical protein
MVESKPDRHLQGSRSVLFLHLKKCIHCISVLFSRFEHLVDFADQLPSNLNPLSEKGRYTVAPRLQLVVVV